MYSYEILIWNNTKSGYNNVNKYENDTVLPINDDEIWD